MPQKKILIISHNVFSKMESMGKTLASYFDGFDSNNLAQFYIHSQIPTLPICKNYFRMTDKEAIKSILGGHIGNVFDEKSIDLSRSDARTDSGLTAKIYQKGRARTPLIYLMRNLWWKLSRWNNKKFNKWIDDFKPDCVFFASGDYFFMYDIAFHVAKSRSIPLYVSCVDDFYFHNRNENNLFGMFYQKMFMHSVKRTMNYATAIFCICDKMKTDYSIFFKKNCYTIHTCASISSPMLGARKRKISYIGNLGFKRNEQLIAIGRKLMSLNLDVRHIDVYSPEPRKHILENLTIENGIVFHGKIDANDVLRVMGESLAVIHTESFDENVRKTIRYSVSTKIADSLSCGSAIFAYGPSEVASISYLQEHGAAVCCTSEDDLANQLYRLLKDESLRLSVVQNARTLAESNHCIGQTPCLLKKVIFE